MGTQARTFTYEIGQLLSINNSALEVTVIGQFSNSPSGPDTYLCGWTDTNGEPRQKWFQESQLSD